MKKISLLIMLSYSCSSIAAININEVRALFESGNSKATYELTVNEARKYEGDPNFDYYYGVSAIDTGHASEGVFALERVLLLQPDNHPARLELARGYFILEEYARARKEFETVLGAEPPEEVRNRINTFLDAIRLQEGRYNTTQSAYIDFGFGSDSNINSASTLQSTDIGGLTFIFGDDAIEQDDSFAEYTLHYGINTPISPGISYFASINGTGRGHSDHSQFNTATYTFDTGFQFLHAQNAYSIDIIAQQFNLAGEEYRQLIGLNTNWKKNLSQQTSLQTYLQYAQQEFEGQETRDVDTVTLGTGFSRRFNAMLSPILFSSIYLAQDSPKLDDPSARANAERDYYGLRIGTGLSISGNKSIQLALDYQSSEYGETDAFTNILRDEQFISATINFTWLLSRNWSMFALASTSQNTSNDSTKEYDRTQYSLNLRYEVK